MFVDVEENLLPFFLVIRCFIIDLLVYILDKLEGDGTGVKASAWSSPGQQKHLENWKLSGVILKLNTFIIISFVTEVVTEYKIQGPLYNRVRWITIIVFHRNDKMAKKK